MSYNQVMTHLPEPKSNKRNILIGCLIGFGILGLIALLLIPAFYPTVNPCVEYGKFCDR